MECSYQITEIESFSRYMYKRDSQEGQMANDIPPQFMLIHRFMPSKQGKPTHHRHSLRRGRRSARPG